jgi:hypothetical protein
MTEVFIFIQRKKVKKKQKLSLVPTTLLKDFVHATLCFVVLLTFVL